MRKRYVEYMSESDPIKPIEDVVGSSILGSDGFVEWVKASFISSGRATLEIPELRQLAPRASVELIVDCVSQYFQTSAEAVFQRGSKNNLPRDIAICLARELSGHTCQALGQMCDHVSGAAITMRHKHVQRELTKSRKTRQDLKQLRKLIKES